MKEDIQWQEWWDNYFWGEGLSDPQPTARHTHAPSPRSLSAVPCFWWILKHSTYQLGVCKDHSCILCQRFRQAFNPSPGYTCQPSTGGVACALGDGSVARRGHLGTSGYPPSSAQDIPQACCLVRRLLREDIYWWEISAPKFIFQRSQANLVIYSLSFWSQHMFHIR